MKYRVLSISVGVVIGVVLGVVLMQVMTPPFTGTTVPSHGLSTVTGCEEANQPRPWVGQVSQTDYQAVYLMNYSFIHDDPDVEVRAQLTESEPGAWILAVSTTPIDSDKDVPGDCQPRTRLDASVALPLDAESMQVLLDGEPVVSIRTTANSPRFHYLDT